MPVLAELSTGTGAGVGKPLEKEPAGSGVWRWLCYGDLAADGTRDERRGGLLLAVCRACGDVEAVSA